MTDLRVHIESFENAMSMLCERTLDGETRAMLTALRSSWEVLADVAFGAIERSRACPSCRRSNVQPGPRCVFCWHRLAAAKAA